MMDLIWDMDGDREGIERLRKRGKKRERKQERRRRRSFGSGLRELRRCDCVFIRIGTTEREILDRSKF